LSYHCFYEGKENAKGVAPIKNKAAISQAEINLLNPIKYCKMARYYPLTTPASFAQNHQTDTGYHGDRGYFLGDIAR
jgi:hypothetical protein